MLVHSNEASDKQREWIYTYVLSWSLPVTSVKSVEETARLIYM